MLEETGPIYRVVATIYAYSNLEAASCGHISMQLGLFPALHPVTMLFVVFWSFDILSVLTLFFRVFVEV